MLDNKPDFKQMKQEKNEVIEQEKIKQQNEKD